jgi:hypothetical protein
VALLRAAPSKVGRGAAAGAALFTLTPWGYLAQLSLLGALLCQRPGPGRRPLVFMAASLLGLCVVTHVVFFGAPRYALVWVPWVGCLLALPGENGANRRLSRVF